MDAHDAVEDATTDNRTGPTWTDQVPATVDARVSIDELPPSKVWETIATADEFQNALVDAVRELLADARRSRPMALYDAGVTALEGGYARLVADLDRAPETDTHQRALELTSQLGQDGLTVLGHTSLEDVADGPLAVLEAVDRTPTIAIRVSQDFRERRRDQREATLSLLATLGMACDVRVVCTGLTARWLAETHRDDLPSSFSERLDARHDEEAPVEELVATARERFDPDGRPVTLLRDLAAEPAETLPYSELRAQHDVSPSRFSQLLSTLEEYDLVARYGKRTDKRVELTKLGSSFLDRLDADVGRQAELDREFSGSGQSHSQAVYPHAHEGPPSAGDPPQPPTATADAPYRTRWLNRSDHAPVVATASSGAVTVVEKHPMAEDADDRRTRFVSYDDRRDEAVVAVRATGPLQYVTSTALALASPRFFDRALPVGRLEDIDVSAEILRGARCVGWLSEEAEDDRTVLRDELVEAGERLASMTTALKRGDYEDRDRFRSEILRLGHGLAGTIVALLDVIGVDVIRELRLPDYPSDERLADLAETLSVATAIQSKYGAFTLYRQVFETDAGQPSLSPEVDAADPLGEFIGGLVIRGPKANRLGQHLEGQLARPTDIHEDAPEISVRVPVTTPDRTAYAETVARMGRPKSLQATREAVSLFRALTGDPYTVADALHWLGTEDRPRDLRLDEVRVALAQLDPKRLLPDAPPTVSKALAALLRTSHPLTQTALAEKADVSTRSIRRHLDVLEALDLVRDVEGGYRIALPNSDDERGQRILPEPVTDGIAAPQDLLFEVALVLVDDRDRALDPDDPIGRAFYWPPDLDALRTHLPGIDPWVRVARSLVDAADPEPVTVEIGPDVEHSQTSLQTAATAGGSR